MSIQSEITRISGLKTRLVTKLVSLGLVKSGASLSDCVTAMENFVPILQDDTTAKKYKLGVDNGIIYIQETTGTAMNLSVNSYKIGVDNGQIYTS